MVEVLVEYDYTANESDELSIKKGDIIRDVVRRQGGWWEGVLNDKKGMFPDNFVKIVDKDSAVTYRNKKDAVRIRKCRVIFSYKQDHEDELNLNIGEIIDIVGEEEEGWWRGRLNSREGVFPSNFVEEIKLDNGRSKTNSREDLTDLVDENGTRSPSLPPKPAKTLCQVKYIYKAQNDDELSLKEGDIVTLISKDGQDPGWWRGELNGRIGVFPDNFVVVVANPEDKSHKDRFPGKWVEEPAPAKLNNVALQRKSLGKKVENDDSENVNRVTPPIPGKKPSIPIKKSPSSSSSAGGLFSGFRKKIVDAVDGAASSKGQPVLTKVNDIRTDVKTSNCNAFDQIERTPMLSDVRATRAKAPGRRPPSVVFKEGEPGVVNGNTDDANLEALSEYLNNSSSSVDQDEAELKPKVREWEKHKAPWLEEMKMNQAKRSSTSPDPGKLKLSSADKNVWSTSPEVDDSKSNKVLFDKETVSPVDMSKSVSVLSGRLKTPPNEPEKNTNPVLLRNKLSQAPVQPSARPLSIHGATPANLSDSHTSKPSPGGQKAGGDTAVEAAPSRQYTKLVERLEKLESSLEQQKHAHRAAIEELRNKLQVETDMRILLQAELDKVAQCVMQV